MKLNVTFAGFDERQQRQGNARGKVVNLEAAGKHYLRFSGRIEIMEMGAVRDEDICGRGSGI
jgi:hypothetical protein